GLHLAPNSVALSTGSVFAGWLMHRSGRYKKINLSFGLFPFIGATLISFLREDSGFIQSWLSIIPLGFGNAVVLQTTLMALLAYLPASHMAVGTGFGQLFRGIGQVGGVAVSSAIFQSRLDSQLRQRIHGPDSEEIIRKIRESSAVVRTLEPELQSKAKESYAIALKTVFIFSAVSTFLAYMVRLPIPDQDLDQAHARRSKPAGGNTQNDNPNAEAGPSNSSTPRSYSPSPSPSPIGRVGDQPRPTLEAFGRRQQKRRLSVFEPNEGTQDLESDKIGGSARAIPQISVQGDARPSLSGDAR
ncbi:unnamed protein product, partial [Mycena citricolor]